MPDDFRLGEEDADIGAPPIETMGARYAINLTRPNSRGRGEQLPPEPYLMPPYHGRHGSNERTTPGIVLTPLGGEMPGPAMPAPQIHGQSGGFAINPEASDFHMGIAESWPEGIQVPVR